MRGSVRVCVDERENEYFFGQVYHQELKEPETFYDINEMVLKIDEVFDLVKYPEASTKHRTFGRPQGRKIQISDEAEQEMEDNIQEKERAGKKATFIVKVQYRQNATWQGQVVWVEKNQTKQFRSALELIKLIDNATEESSI